RGTEPALRKFLDQLSEKEITQPEAPGKWSVAQVLQHLADSDLVWGYRVRMVLAQDRPQLTGYDQDLWAERLRYDAADARQALNDFAVLRQANLRLLARASDDDFNRVGVHAERGEESVRHMIRLYAGHDLLHLQQLARIREAVTHTSES
ncbi:MAG TPA: DinB family protein, partial [Vicinamibacterales bacterium]|nr:DinB family protein [Vicinamibacterales bacterium]